MAYAGRDDHEAARVDGDGRSSFEFVVRGALVADDDLDVFVCMPVDGLGLCDRQRREPCQPGEARLLRENVAGVFDEKFSHVWIIPHGR